MSAEPPDPYLGRVVADKFRVDEQLGVGSFGTVYRATQLQLSRPVALKILRASLAADPTNVERFTREARLASQLDHPNVVRVYDYGTDAEGITYLAMELAEGADLSTIMARESPLDSQRIVRLLSQVLGALSAAHRLGIVHRDLKPDNILVVTRAGDDGRPTEIAKVADFGIARVYGDAAGGGDALTRFGTVNGTPEYMSPEQCLAGDLDGRSDLYACGVLLYEMLAGRLPFTGETALEVLEQQIRDEPRPPSQYRAGIDPRLEAIALRAMQKSRGDRFADAAEMRAALLATLESPAPAPVTVAGASSVLVEIADGDPPAGVSTARAESAPSVLLDTGPSVLIDAPEAPQETPRAPVARTTTERVERPAPPRRTGMRIAIGLVALAAAGGGGILWWRAHPSRSGGGATPVTPGPEVHEAVVDAGGGAAVDHPAVRRRLRPAAVRHPGTPPR